MKYIANPVQVTARRIVGVVGATDKGNDTFDLEDGTRFQADEGMIARFPDAGPGDYVVEQEDGYVYLNPADVFERKYSPAEGVGATQADYASLPVSGYRPQNQEAVDDANHTKAMEERVLRWLDRLSESDIGTIDARWLAIGRTQIEQGFMAVCRSIFQPDRAALPEDEGSGPVNAEGSTQSNTEQV